MATSAKLIYPHKKSYFSKKENLNIFYYAFTNKIKTQDYFEKNNFIKNSFKKILIFYCSLYKLLLHV